MAVGSVWYKNDAGVWVTGMPHTKADNGLWAVGKTIYEKTAPTTWTVRYTGDTTPPAAPPLFYNTYDAGDRTMTTTFTAPADADVTKMCCKISATGYPTQPGVLTTADTPRTVQSDGTEFWIWNTTPSGKSTRKHVGFANSKKYYMSAWAMDAAGNWSAPVNYTWTFAAAPAPAKTLTTKSAYVTTTDSCSYRAAYGWRTDNDHVYQGGDQNLQGFWFYGTKIAALLAKADSVTSIKLYVQRVNDSHGTSGKGQIYIGHHSLTAQPSGSPGSNAVQGEYNAVDLNHNEGAWVTMSSSWNASFKSGAYRGYGMMYGTTSTSSNLYNYCYGYGTSSGKLLITWKEYV